LTTQRFLRVLFLVLPITSFLSLAAFADNVILENPIVRYEVTETGRSNSLIDKSTGVNLLAEGAETPVCTLQKKGTTWESLSITERDGLWHVGFGDADVVVVLRPEVYPTHFTVEVVSVTGEGVDQLNFLYLPLGAQAQQSNLAVCSLALNLQTNVPELPGPMIAAQASCYPRFGLVGAKAALIAAPREGMRATIQQVMLSSPSLPHSPLGGPWALDAKINRGSYLIDTEGEVGESTIDAWIALAKNLGMKQIDFHTGKSMRFGDLRPNPERYPSGAGGVKTVVDQLHEAGLEAGLHTYAFYIAKDTPWVTPVPDRRLATSANFTLDADIDAVANAIPVAESTAGVSTITGFQIRNSVTLRIDDELIVFSGVNTEAPFGFTQCERGALGTTAAPHAKGAAVVQLKECFGLFVPDGDSTLFTEVAARTAEVYNQAGFDMIYLDALDGSDILAGGLNSWHYAAKFVFELNARMDRPALFEMSTITHHVWMLRSRMGAWDVPARGARRLADIHALANESAGRNYMPVNLGWSGIFDWAPVQPERTFASDVEHLCARALATDSSLSLLVGFTPAAWERSANVRRLGGIIQRYETLRLNGGLPAGVLARLRESREPFVVTQDDGGSWQARLRREAAHIVQDNSATEWTVDNPFEGQRPRIRIEGLAGLEPLASKEAQLLADGKDSADLKPLPAAEGVTFSWEAGPGAPEGTAPGLKLTARNNGAPTHSAWGGAGKRFSPALNLYNRGLGLWVHGDGSGAVLNVQLKSTEAAAGGRAEHYVNLDFQGWRYVELVEPESARLGEFGWPYSKRHDDWKGEVPFGEVLHDYILWVNYGEIAELNLWLNNVPEGTTAECVVASVTAVPLRSINLASPKLTVNGTVLDVPVTLKSGDYVEVEPSGDGALYNGMGETVQTVELPQLPLLLPGSNALGLDVGGQPGARARVTLSVFGPLESGS
jgi:hypothetical protein